MLPFVSVIIPIYNAVPYLRQCLDSVVCQTLKNIEIICIDDGSTDNSLMILESYKEADARFKVFTQPNKGAGAARNKGMEVALGKYLSFLDADDFFKPTTLENAVRQCEKDDADLCIYKVKHYNSKTKRGRNAHWAFRKKYIPSKIPFNYKDMPKYIFNTFQNWPWNKLFRHSFVLEHGLQFQELMRTNDLLFVCLALVHAKRITLVKQPLIYYRYGLGTNSQATNDTAPLDFLEAFYALKDALVDLGVFPELEQSFVNWAVDSALYNLNSLNNVESFYRLYMVLRDEGFSNLCVDKHDCSYFFEKRHFTEAYEIMRLSPAEYLFRMSKKNVNILNHCFYRFWTVKSSQKK